MKADASNEQRFIADVDAFDFIAHDVGRMLHAMNEWLAQLSTKLSTHKLDCSGLKAHGTLAKQAKLIDNLSATSASEWARQWTHLQPAQALSDTFDDKVLLLVFGKFNAGKSAFCNLLADRFAAHGKTVEYFYLDAGHIVDMHARFEEGATETTARMQGVRLAGKLVLVDTPGLHSATPENAALTQRFTDSADGVLWLTSSTSPGQVQELDELGRELHRNKPLLPVVTRSDVFEEDEIDGELRKFLRNKTPENRAEQEADVETRAREKLIAMNVEPALLKTPVSISSYLAREQGQTPAALIDAGFERLYAALIAIVEPTLAYKRRKQAEVLLHHLEENVIGALSRDVSPLIDALRASSEDASRWLQAQQEALASALWRDTMPVLPALLDEHSTNVEAISDSLTKRLIESFRAEADKRLGDYDIRLDASLAEIRLDEHKPDTDYQRLHGAFVEAIRRQILRLSGHAIEQCHASIEHLTERAQRLQETLQTSETNLADLKNQLRSEFA